MPHNTFTFKRLVGGRYVTEETKPTNFDDNFQFTIINNPKKPKKVINREKKEKTDFDFEIIKAQPTKGRKSKLKEVSVTKPSLSMVPTINISKRDPLTLYKSIKGKNRFIDLLKEVSLFLKEGEFKKNLPNFYKNIKIVSDLSNLKKEINFLETEINKWNKIREEKIGLIDKIEIKKGITNHPIHNVENSKVLENGKRIINDLIVFLEKKIEKISTVAESLMMKNFRYKRDNCTVILKELSKL